MAGFLLHIGNPRVRSVFTGIDPSLTGDSALKRIRLTGGSQLFLWGDPSADIAYAVTGRQSVVVLWGYFTNAEFGMRGKEKEILLRKMGAALEDESSIATCKKMARQANGSFAFIYYDSIRKKAFCIMDAFGSRPIWTNCTSRPGDCMISTHANAILLARGRMQYDLGGLCSFLLYGSPVDPRKSIYSGIRALEKGSVAVVTSDQQTRTEVWYDFRHNPDRSISPRRWVETASQCLKSSAASVIDNLRQPIVFLSGGLDSRLTASAIRAVGGDPLLVTLCDSENIETRIARKVATALGCRHEVIQRDQHWYLRSLEKKVFECNGTFLWTHCHFSKAYRMMIQKYGADAALVGDFCEAFSKLLIADGMKNDTLWSPATFVGEFDSLRPSLYRPAHRGLTLELLNRDVRRTAEEQLKKDIKSCYRQLRNVSNDPSFVADFFFRWQSAATTATFSMFFDIRSAGAERSLMFDTRVLDLLRKLPTGMRNSGNFGAKLIRHLNPEAAKVPNANSLCPITWPAAFHRTAKAVKPVLGRLRRKMIAAPYKTTSSWPKKSLLYSGDQEWQRLFEHTLMEPSLFAEEVFDVPAIQRRWLAFKRGSLHFSNDLEKLLQIGVMAACLKRQSGSSCV